MRACIVLPHARIVAQALLSHTFSPLRFAASARRRPRGRSSRSSTKPQPCWDSIPSRSAVETCPQKAKRSSRQICRPMATGASHLKARRRPSGGPHRLDRIGVEASRSGSRARLRSNSVAVGPTPLRRERDGHLRHIGHGSRRAHGADANRGRRARGDARSDRDCHGRHRFRAL